MELRKLIYAVMELWTILGTLLFPPTTKVSGHWRGGRYVRSHWRR